MLQKNDEVSTQRIKVYHVMPTYQKNLTDCKKFLKFN